MYVSGWPAEVCQVCKHVYTIPSSSPLSLKSCSSAVKERSAPQTQSGWLTPAPLTGLGPVRGLWAALVGEAGAPLTGLGSVRGLWAALVGEAGEAPGRWW